MKEEEVIMALAGAIQSLADAVNRVADVAEQEMGTDEAPYDDPDRIPDFMRKNDD